MKITKILPFIGLGVVSCAAVGVGTYFVVNNFLGKDLEKISSPFNWDEFGSSAKNFSQKNSFKVSLTAKQVNRNEYAISSGTAWSFYLDDVSSSSNINWYLFTNFHVVNDPVYYNSSSTSSQSSLFYSHNVPITKGFALYDSLESQRYRPLITSNWYFPESLPTAITSSASVNVITDNAKSYNNNDDLNLFSNSPNNINHFYNLDISIIKITLSKQIYNRYRSIFNLIANPYKLWRDNNLAFKNFDANKRTYIAGNPGINENNPDNKEKLKGKLIPSLLPQNSISLESGYHYLNVKTDNPETNPALRALYFRSYSSNVWIENWLLSEGSSGSAVYQLPPNINLPLESTSKENNIFYNLIPIGIYWGGGSYPNDKTLFKPSFIPLVSDRYNIFDNFQHFLTSSYNN